eukprot:ANDGO_04904.mRNA.1 hypothetical protein
MCKCCGCCGGASLAVQGVPEKGSSFVVRYFSANPQSGDWIGIFPVSAVGSSGYLSWTSIDATQKSGTVTMTAPYDTGSYEVRYISNGASGEQVVTTRGFKVV